MHHSRRSLFRIIAFIAGIMLSGVLAGGCLTFLTGSGSFLTFGGSGGNPVYTAFVLGFALSAGLAVYGILGWIQARRLRSEQESGFRDIKMLIDQERESFTALSRLWEQKEVAWQEEKKQWEQEKQSWCKQRENWEKERETMLRNLGAQRRELKARDEEKTKWEEERETLCAVREGWEKSKESDEQERQQSESQMTELSGRVDALTETCRRLEEEKATLQSEADEAEKQFAAEKDALASRLEKAAQSGLVSLTKVSRVLQSTLGRIAQIVREPEKHPERAFEEIQRLTESFTRQFDNLLQLARLEAGDFKLVVGTTDVDRLVSRVVSDVKPLVDRRDIKITYEQTDRHMERLAADERLLQRCVRCLVDNAVKFTEKAGRITLSAAVVNRDGKKQAEIEVRDTGIGIAPADQEKIFQPFVHDVQSRTEISEEGAGIGLSLLRAALNQHGGSVSVQSNVGEGSSFKLIFCGKEHELQPEAV